MTTDKTSTAPVMSLQDIRDLLAGAQPGVVPSRVSLHVTRVRKAIDSLDAHLNAPTPDVVGGDVVVGSWPWLRGVLSGMPSREEPIGGQRHRYLNRDEVLAWIDEGERRATLSHPAEQTSIEVSALAHELWVVAQLGPSEGMLDGVERIESILRQQPAQAQNEQTRGDGVDVEWGIPSTDREMLAYLMRAFDMESWQCPSCGRDEDTKTMDSAIALREYLAKHPTPRQAVPDGWAIARHDDDGIIAISSPKNDYLELRGNAFPMRMLRGLCEAILDAPSAGRMGAG